MAQQQGHPRHLTPQIVGAQSGRAPARTERGNTKLRCAQFWLPNFLFNLLLLPCVDAKGYYELSGLNDACSYLLGLFTLERAFPELELAEYRNLSSGYVGQRDSVAADVEVQRCFGPRIKGL
jgi:hypothetical protein